MMCGIGRRTAAKKRAVCPDNKGRAMSRKKQQDNAAQNLMTPGGPDEPVSLSVRVPRALKKSLKKFCLEGQGEEVSQQQVVTEALQEYFLKRGWKP